MFLTLELHISRVDVSIDSHGILIDKEFSCDAMETYTFYVAAGRVEHRAAACDYIDWTTTGRFQQNLGTI